MPSGFRAPARGALARLGPAPCSRPVIAGRHGGIAAKFEYETDTSASTKSCMSWRPSVKLSVIRDIGWDLWDPIGLNGAEGGWRRSNAADEYDRYLQLVVSNLQSGESDRVMVDYLVNIETTHMRLTDTASARSRAEATVAAIREQVEAIN